MMEYYLQLFVLDFNHFSLKPVAIVQIKITAPAKNFLDSHE